MLHKSVVNKYIVNIFVTLEMIPVLSIIAHFLGLPLSKFNLPSLQINI